jgi:two-component system, LytTR family, response regulator
MKFKVIIVEDEELSRNRLCRLLAGHGQDFELVGEAVNGIEAVEKIQSLKPDLIFLDIQLPGIDGFQVLERLDRQPTIIFTTAHEGHALTAFKTNAIDYLLKPIAEDALNRAIAKFKSMAGMVPERIADIAALFRSLGNAYLSRITCRVGERIYIVKTGEILFFQSDNKYTTVKTSSKTYLIDTPLVELEKQLDPKEFIRIHRSILVNISWIGEIRRTFDGKSKVVLVDKDGTDLPVSRMYADSLKNIR